MMLLYATLALAAPTAADCEPVSPDRLAELAEEARAALLADEPDRVHALHARIVVNVPCLTGVPAPEIWASHLHTLAVLAHARGGAWRAPMRSALRVDPSLVRVVGPTHPLQSFEPDADRLSAWMRVPPGITAYLDGTRVTLLPTAAGVHLLQVRSGDHLRSAWLDAETPSRHPLITSLQPVAPAAPEPRRGRGWRLGGGAVLGVGAGVAAGTWVTAKARPRIGPRGDDALVATNAVGWSAAIAGGVGLGIGLAVGGRSR